MQQRRRQQQQQQQKEQPVIIEIEDDGSSNDEDNSNNDGVEEHLEEIRSYLNEIESRICVTKDGYKIKERLVSGEVEETPVGGITGRCFAVLGIQKTKIATKRFGTSGLRKGSMFHRHIYHELSCKESCNCKERFGTGCRRRTKGSDIDLWVSLALKFLEEKKLVPIRCEVPVRWDCVLATEIDLLALCSDTEKIVNVSWKTGYGSDCMTELDTFRNLFSRIGVPSSIHETHQLQQHIENSMLERCCSELKVEGNFIVYIGYGKRENIVSFKPSQWRTSCGNPVGCIERVFFSDIV